MMSRRPICIANWKMHKTINEAREFIAEIRETARDLVSRSKFHLVWVIVDDEPAAQKLAETIRERLGKICQVSETRSPD